MLKQITQLNNSAKDATTDYFANANSPLLLPLLFSGIHGSPEL